MARTKIYRAKGHRDATALERDGQIIVDVEILDRYTVEVQFEDGEWILADFDEVAEYNVIVSDKPLAVGEFDEFDAYSYDEPHHPY